MTLTLDQRVEQALRAPRAASALRALVGDLAREGHGKSEIVQSLESFVARQRARGEFREADEELVLDILDALGGWCHPGAELLSEKPGH